ncbi:hypothetical protein GN316_03350 [Xylophilus sp. Kf1]|nr:hypothetical protein [Xylophilus sp. Kf1]
MSETETGCEPMVQAMRHRIAELESINIRLRAAIIQRDSELAYVRQARAELEAASPGLPRRVELARRVDSLAERLQSLMREKQRAA